MSDTKYHIRCSHMTVVPWEIEIEFGVIVSLVSNCSVKDCVNVLSTKCCVHYYCINVDLATHNKP